MSSRLAALDLGAAKIACIVADFGLEGPPVVTAVQQGPSRGIVRGQIQEPDAVARSVEAVIREAQREAGVSIDQVVVGLGGVQVTATESRGFIPIYPKNRAITREDVFQALNHSRQAPHSAEREMVMAVPKQWRIDGQQPVASPIGLAAGRLEVSTLLVSASPAQLAGLDEVLTRIGRKVSQVVWRPLASGVGVLSPELMQLGAVVVDLGASGTDVSVFAGGQLVHAATLPVGASHVTSDLAQLLKCSLEEAEELKRAFAALPAESVGPSESVEVMQVGNSERRPMAKRVFCEIVESRVAEIARLVRKEIETGGGMAQAGAGVFLTGGGSRISGIHDVFARELDGAKVRAAAPTSPHALDRVAQDPEWAVAVGLAKFAGQTLRDAVAPAGTNGKWADKLRAFFTSLTGGER